MEKSDLGKVFGKIIGRGRREKPDKEKEEEREKERGEAEESTTTPSATSKIYLKALSLHSLEDLEKIKSEVSSGNILIIKVVSLAEKSIEDVRRAVGELSEFVASVGGDIARLGEERIVLTPPTVRIWREKSSASTSDRTKQT